MSMFDKLGSMGKEGLGKLAGEAGNLDQGGMERMVSQADEGQLQGVFSKFAKQTSPQDFSKHLSSGEGGKGPLSSIGQGGLATIASLFMKFLGGSGGGASSLLSKIPGLKTTDPQQMDAQQVSSVAQYTQQNHPDIFGKVMAALGKQSPGLLTKMVGSSGLSSIIGSLGSKLGG